jgi:hypothetical protein
MINEGYKVVPILVTANINTTVDTDSVDITGAHKVTVIWVNGVYGAAGVFSFNSGTSNAAKTNAVPFKAAMGSAAIGATTSDLLVNATGVAGWTDYTTTATLTCSTKRVVCEIDMSKVTNGDTFLTGTVACATGIVHAVAVIEPRYGKSQSPTVV